MTHVTCRLTGKNRDQLWNPTFGNRVWATFTFLRVDEAIRQLAVEHMENILNTASVTDDVRTHVHVCVFAVDNGHLVFRGYAFSALTLLVGGQEGHPAGKKLSGGVVICLERGADLHMAQLTPLPLPLTVSCFSKIQIGFTFLVPAHLGSPGQKAIKLLCFAVTQLNSL